MTSDETDPQEQMHARERVFWDAHVPSIEACLREVEAGPDPNTVLALDALSPLDGRAVLDVGCGAGILSAWLAQSGAVVTGVDISQASVERAYELHRRLGLETRFIAAAISAHAVGEAQFDRLTGRYVLHHLDLSQSATELGALLKHGGIAAFVETMTLNPLLRLARTHLAGRCGIPRYGSADECPLVVRDLVTLERAFGECSTMVAELTFFRIFDRQVLHYRSPTVSRFLGSLDNFLLRLGLDSWSYHQVVFLRKADDQARTAEYPTTSA